jgi:hypothetical protein
VREPGSPIIRARTDSFPAHLGALSPGSATVRAQIAP